ncbi:MAG: hypothetical protein L6R48_13100 [Planctomycetes bacterium]|nr:hypothetical protein [Planctomycetota bacterium]
MDPLYILLIVIGALICLLGLFVLAVLKAFYRTVEQGHALIITRLRSGAEVSFSGAVVLPVVNRAEVMDISLKTIEVDRRGPNGLICKDNIRADLKVTFFVRINKTAEDVLRVATSVGVARASDQKTLEELFQAKFSEALKTVGKRMDFVDLYNQRDTFKDEIVKVIGRDLNGYSLEDAAIDQIEQTPLEVLDPDNILDSEGRKKIIELTAIQAMKANDIRREAEKVMKKQDVEAREVILNLERQQAEAEARQTREIGTVKARESAEQAKVEAEERLRSEQARVQSEQELSVQKQNAQREVEIAAKNREGAVMVENERIQKEKALEAIARERATELARIEQEKIIAQERKTIAEVIRERVAVEKTVAEEEERIKDVRVLAEARRVKDSAVIAAEQTAEEGRIATVKKAEAAATAATHHAKEQLVLAEAEQAAVEKQTQAAIRRAEGKQAEVAAPGLAAARVKEVDAAASEKQGLAKARVLQAEAEAQKIQGLAQIEVKRADADAVKLQGMAQVEVKRADADAVKLQGMAQVEIKRAEAKIIEEVGEAEALAIEQKLKGEAKGLAEKAEAMAKLSEGTKAHEEFRLRLASEVEVAKAKVHAEVEIAEQNALVLAEAMKNAKFDIVGGDGAYFERFARAISLGKGLDGAVGRSEVLQKVAKEYLEDGRSLPEDVIKALKGMSSGDVANLAAAAALIKK